MNWEQAWLEYSKNSQYKDHTIFNKIFVVNRESIEGPIQAGISELSTAFAKMFDITPTIHEMDKASSSEAGIYLQYDIKSHSEAYSIKFRNHGIIIKGQSKQGILYGIFAFIRELVLGHSLESLDINSEPMNPLRIINHWDNMDGSIERGYSGESFFFEKNQFVHNERITDYARLLASIGINGVVINNVNVAGEAIQLITKKHFQSLKKYMTIFSSYGIKLFLSLDYAASIDLGGLESSDPFDEDVIDFWNEKISEIYDHLDGFGGFLIKADSEGRPGPFTYGRTHADGANMLAKFVKPFGGIIIWRCFVYNCQQDWRDLKTDRARSGYDHFKPLDSEFDDNVILQIKNGPMDFQVREPVSPLIGAMPHTNQILEVQIAQEYTGQQKHVCYLIPMFKEILDFKTYNGRKQDLVSDVVSGRCFGNRLCGMATVTNTGNDSNWTGHDLAGVNLYGFGRLAWNTDLTAEEIAIEWIAQTFGHKEAIVNTILSILMMSWPTYEKYTSPLGIGWMVNPNHHYGPNVDGYEYDRWGTYHRSDHLGMGVDRTENGTGFTKQYFPENGKMYEDKKTCPEELLLFFHRVDYKEELKSGKTLIQHIYDTHFEGVKDVMTMIKKWKTLIEEIDDIRYNRVLARLEHQLEHSILWRDRINTYYYRMSGIKDEKGRTIY